jgi:hypothetical protein
MTVSQCRGLSANDARGHNRYQFLRTAWFKFPKLYGALRFAACGARELDAAS